MAILEKSARLNGFARLAGVVATVSLLAGVNATAAVADSFEGLWRGSGYVYPANGQREQVRCRVVFSRLSSERYEVTARCAAQSANIDQSGVVRRTGRNSYSGMFYNADFNVRGRIRIRVSGRRQSVSLSSENGTGHLTLFKR